MITLTAKEDGVTFAVRVRTRASKSGVAGELDGAIKIRLAAPPVDGEANEELVRFLAKLFRVPRQQIALISGQKSKNKLVRVSGVSAGFCERVLAETLK